MPRTATPETTLDLLDAAEAASVRLRNRTAVIGHLFELRAAVFGHRRLSPDCLVADMQDGEDVCDGIVLLMRDATKDAEAVHDALQQIGRGGAR